jgi:hypothetical protein
MIDYEKLKKCVDIVNKSDVNSFSINFGTYTSNNDMDIVLYKNDKIIGNWRSSNLNDLLIVLEQKPLTQSKPKYKVGDVVYYSESWDIYSFEVASYSWRAAFNDWYYEGTDEDGASEDYLYATRMELIQSQIDHWQSLKESDTQSNQHQIDADSCQHEFIDDCLSFAFYPPKLLCKKCGEFC